VALQRNYDGAEPIRPEKVGRVDGTQEERRVWRTWHLASGTLACPACDAPVMPDGIVAPADPLSCAFCLHRGVVRDFLSLSAPTRSAHVVVRVVAV
jgi:hypothetical protein